MKSTVQPDNPLGIIALDHLEFITNDTAPMENLFYKLGLSKSYEHNTLPKSVYSQGQIRFLLNSEGPENSLSGNYFKRHGDGVCRMSFWVEDAEFALSEAIRRGATVVEGLKTETTPQGLVRFGSIQGFGDVINEFVERPSTVFRKDYLAIPTDPLHRPLPTRLSRIDHLTNNVPKGEMNKWADFYEKIFGMVETRYFDIQGAKTGLVSKVMQLKNKSVIIPINEPDVEGSKSQIQEFLDLHKGAGVQHIALTTPDILSSVGELHKRNIEFLSIPKTYYEDIPNRPFVVEEPLKDLEDQQILVDGDEEGYLLQIFSKSCVGPLFFEFIQRKGHHGFGDGNFGALFKAIERDQIQRGYLK